MYDLVFLDLSVQRIGRPIRNECRDDVEETVGGYRVLLPLPNDGSDHHPEVIATGGLEFSLTATVGKLIGSPILIVELQVEFFELRVLDIDGVEQTALGAEEDRFSFGQIILIEVENGCMHVECFL